MSNESIDQGGAAPRWRRELLVQALILLGALVAMFPGVFLRGELASGADLLYASPPWDAYTPPGYAGPGNVVMPDIITAMLPYYALTQQALAHGEWPLWNPLEMAGLPLLANCQSAVFYPPRLLHAFLDLHTATSLYYLLKLWLCGMTAFACARGLGFGLFAARFFSIAWAMNGFCQVWCYWPLPDVCAWLPILFFGAEMAARGRLRAGIFGVASGGALMLLAGHPESAFTQAFGVGIYLFFRLMLGSVGVRVWLRAGLACGAGWLLALGVTASQWLPFLEYLAHSYTLHERSGDSFGNFVPTDGVLTFFVPRFFGTNAERSFWADETFNLYSYYPGMLAWAGAAVAVLLLRGRERRPMVGALLITALLSGLWAFNATAITMIFKVPGLQALRLNYHIATLVFAVCVLAALGLDQWLQRAPRRAAWGMIALIAAVGVACTYAGMSFFGALLVQRKSYDYVQTQVLHSAVFAVVAVIALAVAARLRSRRVAEVALLLLLFVDLTWNLRGMNPTVPRASIYPKTALTDRLQQLPPGERVQAGAGFIASGLLVPYGIEDWLGYDGLYPERIMRFNAALGTEIWKTAEPICSIPYYLRNPKVDEIMSKSPIRGKTETFPWRDTDYFEKIDVFNGIEIFRNKRALPRAYVAGAVQRRTSADDVFKALLDPAFVPGAVVYSEAAPEGTLPSTPGPAGTAEIVEHTPTRVRVHVNAARAGALVLSDAYYPGWRAAVNGAPAKIFPAYYAFRGVLVPAGESTVEFTYFPRSFQMGLAISFVTLIVGGLGAMGILRIERR